jgi:hypothetical protein
MSSASSRQVPGPACSTVVVALLLALLPVAGYADPLSPTPAGNWATYPNSTLRPAMGNAPGNPRFIFDYSGGWFDEERVELGVWGGGHADYPGSEVCTFPLATGIWTCGPRSAFAQDSTTETTADGHPSARRTYSCIARVNVPGYDGFFCHGGSLRPGGRPTAATWFYHRDTATWERLADRPNWGESDSGKTSSATYAVFDKARNRVLVRARNMCLMFDMRTKAWEWGAACVGMEKSASAAFDPERQTLIVMGAGTFDAWDTSTTAWRPLAPVLSGDQAPVAAWGPGLVFDPVGKRFLAYIGGKDLYELNRDTWAFTKITGAGADPGAQYPVGTHGRFRYVPSTNGLVVINSIDSNVFYFQLGGTPPPSPPPTLAPPPRSSPLPPLPSPPPSPAGMPTLTITVGVPACAFATPSCLRVEVKQVVLP